MGKLILIFEMSSEEKKCVCKYVGCLDECESEGDWVVCGECSYVDCVCVYACNVCNYFDCVCGGYESKSDSEKERACVSASNSVAFEDILETFSCPKTSE